MGLKVCVIGDVHGTQKWNECYKKIQHNDNDCDLIICLGDWFDPYDSIKLEDNLKIHDQFKNDMKNDKRIISILGNHDLAYYIIDCDVTNRTYRYKGASKITESIKETLPDSYLVYKVGNYLFSHAGVSQSWLNRVVEMENGEKLHDRILSNYKGWHVKELSRIVNFYHFDFSGYGDDPEQGCTWIRPQSLLPNMVDGFNQVVGHTQVKDIASVKSNEGLELWLVDNQRKPEYLTLNIGVEG